MNVWSSCDEKHLVHRACWTGDHEKLAVLLQCDGGNKDHLDEKDLHGNTPLHIAAHFGDSHAVKMLLDAGACPDPLSRAGWYPFDEAVATGAQECCQLIYLSTYKKYKQVAEDSYPDIAKKLKSLPDFYFEIHWAFSSWIPLVSSFFPHDVYKITKKGSWIKASSTLVGFKNLHPVRGHMSYYFLGEGSEKPGHLLIIDEEKKTQQDLQECMLSSPEAITSSLNYKLSHDICSHSTNEQEIAFEPTKGWWSGKQKHEKVDHHDTAVYHTSGFEFRSFIRSDPHAKRTRIPRSLVDPNLRHEYRNRYNEYFCGAGGEGFEDGLVWPTENLRRNNRSFKGSMWLAPTFPLKNEDLMSILDILSPISYQTERLKNFVAKLPGDGFPVKIEIPIFFGIYATAEFRAFHHLKETGNPLDPFAIPDDLTPIYVPWTGGEMREMFKATETTSAAGGVADSAESEGASDTQTDLSFTSAQSQSQSESAPI
mmetsp:Transcript_29960/g.75388  ORF Transcript_29960/g.75388 Transcript_29960/m.75388 type:complete len:482 (-) Transcript_29960:94-1539(-)